MAYNAKTDWKLQDIVQPQDLNRIEQGIKDADNGKAATDLSNVSTATFAAKAKAGNIETFDAAAKNYYVSPSGNDTTGAGTQASPFQTIQRAISAIPESNPTGVDYTITLMPGTHTGFQLKSNKRIKFATGNDVTINGNIEIYSGNVQITRTIICTGGITVDGGILVLENVTFIGGTGATYAVTATNFGLLNVTGVMKVTSGYGMTVLFSNTTGYIRQLISEITVGTGISCRGAAVYVGSATLDSVPTKYSVSYGGRIFIGAETIIQE